MSLYDAQRAQVHAERMKVCAGCDQRKPLPFGREGCKQWSCPCVISWKAWLSDTKCPLGKWPK